ncbi:MAG: hypothetical protein NC218_04085 [Acetobacter sp.]|nr:hypothetical protein [Acetobacter sp.]
MNKGDTKNSQASKGVKNSKNTKTEAKVKVLKAKVEKEVAVSSKKTMVRIGLLMSWAFLIGAILGACFGFNGVLALTIVVVLIACFLIPKL